MKYFWKMIAFTCIAVPLSASELKTELMTDPVRVGIENQLALIHNGPAVPEFKTLPQVKGLRWISAGSSQSVKQINGRITRTMMSIYNFVVDKPGKYTIPSVKVKAGRNTFRSEELTFDALPMKLVSSRPDANDRSGEAETEIGKLIFARINIVPDRREFYIGEEIPLEIQVYTLANLNCRINWPEIRTGDKTTVIFRDYKTKNPENPRFDTPRRARTTIKGKTFDVYLFQTVVRPISAGKLDLSASDKVLVTIRSSRASRSIFDDDDDFFGSFFGGGRRIEHVAQADAEPIRIKPLPPQKGNSDFLGLLGDWNIRFILPEKKYKVGEAVTLTVSISGTGSTDPLNAPSLEIPGFRVYSPEVEKKGNSAVIKYVLIPTEPGKHEMKLSFSTFDPLTGKYEPVEFKKLLNTEKAAHLFKTAEKNSVVDASSAPEEELSIPGQEKKAPSGVLYLKKPPFHDELQIPLWKNSVFTGLAVILAGLIFWLLCEIRVLHEKIRSSDPGFQRRNDARKAKPALLRRLRECPPENLAELDAEIASYVNNAQNFPPGASLSESSEFLKEKDPELAESLGYFSRCSWSHSGFSAEFKKKLLVQLSKLVCTALIFFAVPAGSSAETKKIDSPEAAMTAYDEGHFAEAEHYYRSMMKKSEPSAKLCYNIGNCLYQQGKYAHALAQYEKAMRLAPRDSDILENLNLTRRKLSLPQKHILNSPSDVPPYLRDMFRPDEWFLLTGIGLMLIFCGLGLRRLRIRSGYPIAFMIVGAAVALLSMTAVISQYSSSYDDAEAIVLTRSSALHTLPSDQSPKLNDITLQPGETVHIEETRLDWVRIRTGAAEGWVRRQDIQPILTH